MFFRKRRNHSLRFRILILLLAATVAIHVVIAMSWRLMMPRPQDSGVHRLLRSFLIMSVRELGEPPAPADLQRFIRDTDIHTEYVPLAVIPLPADTSGIESIQIEHQRPGVFTAKVAGRQGTFVFHIDARKWRHRDADALFLIVAGIILTVTFVAFKINKWLRPLRELRDVAGHIRDRDLKARARVVRQDEIGEVAHTFNTMVDSLESEIRSREILLQDMSHEIRSPLARLRLAAELLESGELRDQILKDIRVVTGISDTVLEEAALQNAELQLDPVDVAVWLPEFLKAEYPEAVYHDGCPDHLVVNLHGEKIRSMLRNLLDNAFRHAQHDDPQVNVASSVSGNELRISIQDNGPGVPEALRRRIFDPFVRESKARTPGEGVGLGLSIARRIAQRHGGSLLLEGGNTFVILLPIPVAGL